MRSARTRLPGHPDKACDLVVEAIVDEYLRRDPESRLSINAIGGRGAIFVCGDVKSDADFDVTSIVRQTLGKAGVIQEFEPFIAIEQVAPEQREQMTTGPAESVTVVGYATQDTVDMLPRPVSLSRVIAKRLYDLRTGDETWFWLGADGEVAVHEEGNDVYVRLLIEHGSHDLSLARNKLTEVVRALAPEAKIKINPLGPNEVRGLHNVSGASGKDMSAYGPMLPAVRGGIGYDLRHPEKSGAWLARAAARKLVAQGAKSAMVQLVYEAGDSFPSHITARDEKGNDLSSSLDKEELSIKRVLSDWQRPGLNSEAALWGFAGQAGLPWEE